MRDKTTGHAQDDWRQNLSPKLRMIADGDGSVNIMRASQCSAMRVPNRQQALSISVQRALEVGTRDPKYRVEALPEISVAEAVTPLTDEVEVSVFLRVPEGLTPADLEIPCAIRGTQAVVRGKLADLRNLINQKKAVDVELGSPLHIPLPVELGDATDTDEAPEPPVFHSDIDHRGGADVLIGIIDVQGFDFSHPDFRADGGTRFIRIWDQGAAPGVRPPPNEQPPINYGAEFHKSHLDAAIDHESELGVPAYEIERQSQLAPGSHGTHVASIAAGNTGVCPNAKIAGVLIALSADDLQRRSSFYDSTRLVDAVEYLLALAKEEDAKAVAINISLGTNGHAHDGSDPTSRWIDSALTVPGRAVCVAAGNAGQERSLHDEDLGFVIGRIHTSGRFDVGDTEQREIQFHVVGNTIEDISENELEIWYSSRDRIAVELIPPQADGEEEERIESVEPNELLENHQLADGTFVSIYNKLYHAANGSNVISIYLSPFFGETAVRGVRPGIWTVRLIPQEIRDGEFHGWLERDDPRPIRVSGSQQLWNFPAFFTQQSNRDDHSISSLGCGERVVAVANFAVDLREVNISSSQGPTRDGREKPDVGARGTDVLAANGFNPDTLWTKKTGTSMASPFVCGVSGLMLSVNPNLTGAQILGILRRTARPITEGDFAWKNDSGFGLVDPEAALREAASSLGGVG